MGGVHYTTGAPLVTCAASRFTLTIKRCLNCVCFSPRDKNPKRGLVDQLTSSNLSLPHHHPFSLSLFSLCLSFSHAENLPPPPFSLPPPQQINQIISSRLIGPILLLLSSCLNSERREMGLRVELLFIFFSLTQALPKENSQKWQKLLCFVFAYFHIKYESHLFC